MCRSLQSDSCSDSGEEADSPKHRQTKPKRRRALKATPPSSEPQVKGPKHGNLERRASSAQIEIAMQEWSIVVIQSRY